MKNIVLFFDGTWQNKSNESNIAKMYDLCEKTDQVVYYDAGVGSAKSYWDKFTGGAFGAGVQTNILQAYDFLRRNYIAGAGDKVYVFGFSRGAFTARSLVGFMDMVGLPGQHSRLSSKKLFNIYKEKNIDAVLDLIEDESTDDVDVKMVGVFDTVKSIGSPFNLFGINKKWAFHDSTVSMNTENAYHALSIDENRTNFKPVLWTERTETLKHIEQRWFPGSHCDIGGGYEDDDSASINPVKWMIKNAQSCGLRIKQVEECAPRVPLIHDSYKDMFFGVYSTFSKRTIRYIHSNIPGFVIDYSVTSRMKNDSGYKPKNILSYLARSIL